MNEKTIYTMRLAFFLMDKGFKPVKVLPQVENPHYRKWIFEDSEDLHLAINEYMYQYYKNK